MLTPAHRFLVFTSAGDHAQLHRWFEGRRNFDVWITYYGDARGTYSELTPFYDERKGGKFPNLLNLYTTHPELTQQYDAILVADDDLVIDATGISRLFEMREQYDLWVLQPAFDWWGRVSYSMTGRQAFTTLRFTNFVEMTCPLFRQDKLKAFMEVFDPSLVGWGADEWFMHVLGPVPEDRVAVIDRVSCRNPHHQLFKRGRREIDGLQATEERRTHWEAIARKLGIEPYSEKVQFAAVRDGVYYEQLVRVAISRIAYAVIRRSRNLFQKLARRGPPNPGSSDHS